MNRERRIRLSLHQGTDNRTVRMGGIKKTRPKSSEGE